MMPMPPETRTPAVGLPWMLLPLSTGLPLAEMRTPPAVFLQMVLPSAPAASCSAGRGPTEFRKLGSAKFWFGRGQLRPTMTPNKQTKLLFIGLWPLGWGGGGTPSAGHAQSGPRRRQRP